MSKTLNKGNYRMVERLFAAADPESCKVYTKVNGFDGEACSLDRSRLDLAQSHRSKLIEQDNGLYLVQIHSNLWYTFKKATCQNA